MNKQKLITALKGCLVITFLLYTPTASALKNTLPTKPKTEYVKKPAPKPAEKFTEKSARTITNAWFTMQSGSTPWGYYHELIEKKEDRYFYRYEMTKKENGMEYTEAIGGVAEDDLTPVAFNLSKAGKGSTEIINGIFTKNTARDSAFGQMVIDIQGAKKSRTKSSLNKGTILEIFFPVWLSKHWPEFHPGKRGGVNVFTEDPSSNGFTTRRVQFTVGEKDGSLNCNRMSCNCTRFDIELDGLKSQWCVQPGGAVQWMNINNNQIQVRQVLSETQAKAFLDDSPKK